ncbi:MAG: hypothetical protein ACPGL0_01275, partial [Limisphaerales bacterium]
IDNVQIAAGGGSGIAISAEGGQIAITWESGALQTAPAVTGPWTPVDGASSPYTVDASQGQAFFRAQ